MRRFLSFAIYCLTVVGAANAQAAPDWYPKVDDVVATFVNTEGEREEVEMGGTYDAPLTVTFEANPTDTVDYNVLYEWRLFLIKDNKESLLVKRNEMNTTFSFTEGGADVSYRVELYITYHYRPDMTISGEGELPEPITFSLRGSSLQLYNAFSPNGDGTNDVYRVKTQSLLSFRMKIFNRWGQEIVAGDQSTLTAEHENDHTYYVCWDGTYHGRVVEDGVYFILVEAEGSDGIKYVRRGDINVLTNTRKEEKQ